jgi:hypothetical protein
MICLNCTRETANPKFCSRSCAATYNNKHHPKRSLESTCKRCQGPCTRQRTYCRKCWHALKSERAVKNWSTATLSEMRTAFSVNAGRFPYVRTLARKAYKASGQEMKCFVCGYDLHVDVAHLKAVNSFSDDTPVNVVNDLNNLRALCRNHHWEYDHGYLSL